MPDDFKSFYNEILQASVAASIPEAIRRDFEFLSCLAFDERKELYLVSGRRDGRKGVLRVTKAEALYDALAEAGILSGLNHPAIPKIIWQWSTPDRSYLLREYVDGMTIGDLVKRQGVLKADRIYEITVELCDVLSYLHSRNPAVIHRDIKPENIILTKDSGAKLIDFGIARQFSTSATKDTMIMGTEPYMAPEQFGSEQTDGRADVYSLGVLMVFMATGGTDKADLKRIYPYKPLIPVIQKSVKKDRDQRFASAAQLKKKLLRVQRKAIQKTLISAGAVLLVIAALLLGYYIGHERGHESGYDSGLGIGREQGYGLGSEHGFESGFGTGKDQGYEDGYEQGLEQGFRDGVDSIMDSPTERNQPFTQEELYEPITFDSWYLDMAVRNALNKNVGDVIYRTEVTSRIDAIRIYGTFILHPSLDDVLLKKHVGKGTVAYSTDRGFWIDDRGDISTLAEIPNMYYLRDLTLTSQSITDLKPIEGMKLERICLADNFVGNLLPLKDMVTLRELDFCQNPLRDLTPISRLLSLEALDISQTQVTDLTPLSDLTMLKSLSLAYCDVSDISVLANMTYLQELDISNTLVTDLTPLLGRAEPLTVICDGLPDDVVAQMAGAENVIVVF